MVVKFVLIGKGCLNIESLRNNHSLDVVVVLVTGSGPEEVCVSDLLHHFLLRYFNS